MSSVPLTDIDVLRTGQLPPANRDERRSGTYGEARFLPLIAGLSALIVDSAAVLFSFLVAHWARFVVADDGAPALGLENYGRMGLFVSMGTVLIFAVHRFYDFERPRHWVARIQLIVSGISTALVLAVATSFFLGDERFSRLWFGAGWSVAIAALVAWRFAAHRLYGAVRQRIAPAKCVVIVGANQLGQQLARELPKDYRVAGYVDNGSDLNPDARNQLLGPIAMLDRLVDTYSVDELIVALPAHRREQIMRTVARGFRRHVKIKFLPELGDLAPRQFEVQDIGGRPYIGFAAMAQVTWMKRATDLTLGGVILAALVPVFVLIAIAIKLDSPGPVLYRQIRVGKHGRLFQIYKFRSMRQDADKMLEHLGEKNEAIGPLFKIREDPRITRVGKVLRRFSLDEFPQLLNVLRGEMSLVGPRPPVPVEVQKYEDWQLGRLRAVPGMTGLWQVSGRSEVPFHDMVRLDLHYIRNWSFVLDLELLWRTIPAVLAHRGAY
jgi:exopolysaccharide biosynthesis polyprenyl glycosylphosphotransferase